MNNLDSYVEEKRKLFQEKNITDELEIIRYIYLDLGTRFSFDNRFIPFGNSKFKQNLYRYHSRNINDLNECMRTNTAICKSLSYILEYVLKKFEINIETVEDICEHVNYPHVYNYIKCRDGRNFCVDLQDDINNIQTKSHTSNFGIASPFTPKIIISKFEQEQLDRKLGYLKENECYTDDYLYLLHSVADGIDDFREKVGFILENIDIVPTNHMGYIDRQWHHKKILENFFNTNEFDYINNTGKIRMYDCYKDANGKRNYYNFIIVMDNSEVDVYIYNAKESNYQKMKMKNYVNCVTNGLVVHKGKIPYLKQKIAY